MRLKCPQCLATREAGEDNKCRSCGGYMKEIPSTHKPWIKGNNMNAARMLKNAAGHIEDRAASRDTPQERSMAKCVKAFNVIYDKDLTETEGWQFMTILKKVRGAQGEFRLDDYEDDIAYAALAAESAITKEDDNVSKDS